MHGVGKVLALEIRVMWNSSSYRGWSLLGIVAASASRGPSEGSRHHCASGRASMDEDGIVGVSFPS